MADHARNEGRSRGPWWDLAAATLILLLPLAIFFRHNDYPLLQPEVGLCALWVFGAGACWAGLMTVGRTVGRVLVTTLLLLLLVDVQTDWLTTVGLRLLLNLVAIGGVAWLLRRRLSQVVVVLFGAMLVATVVQPPGRMVRQQGTYPAPGRSDLPFVLHIILDEYAAPEALDRNFDPDGAVAGEVQAFFVDHGFTLYSRAYSRLFNTDESIPNLLNRGLAGKPNAFWDGHFRKGALLVRNDWFEHLEHLGYGLHVFQSDFITYAAADGSGQLPPRVSISDYTLETVHGLAGTDLAVEEKVRFIFGSYYRLSWFLGMFRDQYAGLRRGPVGRALHLPDWDTAGDRVSPLTTMQAFDVLAGQLGQAQPGQAVFAHLLLPHFPYAFGADCGLEPMGRKWLNAIDEDLAPGRNDAASRAARYPLYLAQLQCTNQRLADLFAALRQAGVWDRSLVILHGDHGCRLNLVEPLPENADSMTAADYMDAFGTLLAIKWPGGQGALDRRQVPLDDVFGQLFLTGDGQWPPAPYQPGPALLAAPWVLLNDRQGILLNRPLPGFADGRAGQDAPLIPVPSLAR
jgi:hypothetical protein